MVLAIIVTGKKISRAVRSYSHSSTMVVTFWPIRLLKRRLINHLSNLQVIYQPNKIFINLQVIYQPANAARARSVGGVIGCQLSNFPNSCVASSPLQEELSFLCLARERSLQQMTKTMLISLYVRFWEPWRKETSPIIRSILTAHGRVRPRRGRRV